MNKLICIQYPHLFKPMQAINAVIIMICLGSTTNIASCGVLWFIALLSLVVSTIATIIFMMNKDDPIITNRTFSWNILEFCYSSILSILSGISFVLALLYTTYAPENGNLSSFSLTGLFMLVQSTLYATPAILLYDRFQSQNNNYTLFNNSHQPPIKETRYQTVPNIV